MTNALTHKVCTSCNCTKPLDAFHIDKRREGGRKGICAECYRIRALAYCDRYRAAHHEAINETQRARRAWFSEGSRDAAAMPLFEITAPSAGTHSRVEAKREIPLLAEAPRGVVGNA